MSEQKVKKKLKKLRLINLNVKYYDQLKKIAFNREIPLNHLIDKLIKKEVKASK